jgi:outer membrane protein
MKKTLIASALLSGAMLSTQAQAFEPGDWIVRVGATGIYPEDTDSDPVTQGGAVVVPGSAVGPDDAWSLGLTIGYAVTDNVVVELLGAWPFTHDIESNNTLSDALAGLSLGRGDIGEIKHLPPTLTVQYHFMPKNSIRPFVGAGINYFYPYDEEVKGPLKAAGYNNLDVDDSWGLALQAGVDFDVNEDWFVTADVRWIDIEVDAEVTGGALGPLSVNNINVDPWVVSFMVGTRF